MTKPIRICLLPRGTTLTRGALGRNESHGPGGNFPTIPPRHNRPNIRQRLAVAPHCCGFDAENRANRRTAAKDSRWPVVHLPPSLAQRRNLRTHGYFRRADFARFPAHRVEATMTARVETPDHNATWLVAHEQRDRGVPDSSLKTQ